ncbi:uncharacterized protein LOC125046227 [Penaeus chinensis]|uniref:uncharacterized protein LOC125046227 n=1 Tax=Penaeus chinensis TaxID=139456 RepID=UPI001FB730C2|nr:uncharacterized protein LOC125046227 [Penaeus chinensis]
MPRARFHVLLLLSLVSLGHDALGTKIEGLLGYERTREQENAAVETPTSAGREDVLSAQEPGKISPGTQSQTQAVPTPAPVTSHSAPHVPVFIPSEFPRAPDGLNRLYIPPIPPATQASVLKHGPCPGNCEIRNANGDCEMDVKCLFDQSR